MAEQHGKALVPQIRFAGFTDPWEQRKLGEVAPLQRGFDLPVSQMISGPYPVVMSNGVGGWHSKYAVKGPGVVTGRSGTIGGLQYIEGDFWPHNTSLWVTSFNSNEPKFIYWLYSSMNLERFGSGSGVPTLNRNDVHDQLIGVPCNIAEQRQIGAFFDCLDSLITLHQRKYDKLCVLKKSMLDKMFPKGGSLYPEIRFAGFTDPWEQRKLSSTCEQLSRTINPLETPNEEFTEYSMPAFDNNETAETVIGNSMNSLRKIVDRPCLLVNKLNVRKKRIWHVPRPEANAVCSSEFVPFSSHSSDLSFIKISLLSERITAYLESCSSGSSNSQKRVTPEIIMSSEIIAPSLAEQRRIGAFFDRLDSLITLHQRKLELLRNIKKSMLDKMFV